MTQVIATVWKDPYYRDRNQRMIEAGVDVFRMKCSYLSTDELSRALQECRAHIDSSGSNVKLLADLPEAKIRLGEFLEQKVQLAANRDYHFQCTYHSPDLEAFIPINHPHLAKDLMVGENFYLGDGQIQFTITNILDENRFIARSNNSAQITSGCSVTIPSVIDSLDLISPELDEILKELPKSRPDMVAFSFVSSKKMLETLIAKLVPYTTDDWHPMIIAKIESQEGIDNIDEILELAQGIMVARGDLGLNVPYAKLGLVQKQLVRKARIKNKYVIVATGMLQSLLDNYVPTRSDILDVTNAALDGADAVMLCRETCHSETPERAVQVAKEIIAAVEESRGQARK